MADLAEALRRFGARYLARHTLSTPQARAWRALGMPVIAAKAMESAADFMRRVARVEVLCCPRCKVGRLAVVQTLASLSRLPAPHAGVRQCACRGPP